MYSQCPECQTRFRVTAAALRAAHGTVRCGRCGSAFDALQSLTDSLDEPPPAASMPARAELVPIPIGVTGAGTEVDVNLADLAESPLADAGAIDDGAVVTEFHFSADDIERVFIDARDWQRQFGGPEEAAGRPEAPPLEDAADGEARRKSPQEPDDLFVHEPEAVEDITLEGERIVIEGLPDFFEDEAGEPYTGRDDAVRLEAAESPGAQGAGTTELLVDLDATDEFEILRNVPEAAEPPADLTATPAANEPDVGDAPAASTLAAVAAVAAEATAPAEAHAESEAEADAESGPGTETAAATAQAPAPPIVPFRLRDRSRTLQEAELDDLAADAHDDADGAGRRSGALWAVGAVLLVFVLLGQVVHHYRHELVRDARIGDTLRNVYAQLGQPLAPDWDLASFELQQWGTNESDITSGAMTVRASLRNGAQFAQPLPLLRMEFEDRFGGTVARRDFEPKEYLKDPAQASRLLGPGDRTEAELAVVDVGPDAVGYRLDVCLRDESAGLRCAQSASPDGPQLR